MKVKLKNVGLLRANMHNLTGYATITQVATYVYT